MIGQFGKRLQVGQKAVLVAIQQNLLAVDIDLVLLDFGAVDEGILDEVGNQV